VGVIPAISFLWSGLTSARSEQISTFEPKGVCHAIGIV
jgi:hypothetical protein